VARGDSSAFCQAGADLDVAVDDFLGVEVREAPRDAGDQAGNLGLGERRAADKLGERDPRDGLHHHLSAQRNGTWSRDVGVRQRRGNA